MQTIWRRDKILRQHRFRHSFLRGGTRSLANLPSEPPRLLHVVPSFVIITCDTAGGYQSFGEILQGTLEMEAACET